MSLRAVAFAAAVLVAAVPARAEAHAAFVSAEPQPGAELGSTPGVVALRFSEPLVEDLSSVAVVLPGGERVEGAVSGEREMAARLTTSAPGVYRVEWVTVSPLDGHTLRGAFRFGVGADPGAGAEGRTADVPRGPDLLLAVARALEYVGLLLAVGMVLVGRLARNRPELAWVRPRISPVTGAALAAGLLVVVGEALLAAGGVAAGPVVAYLTSGTSGWARLARLAAEAGAVVAVARRRSPLLPLVAALVGLAAAGHAAAASPRWLAISADAAHVLAAGLWAGGIGALTTLRPPGGWRGGSAADLLRRFSPVALPAFVLTVGFGAIRGAQEMTSIRELVTTGYGNVLLAKVLAVAAMVPLSVMTLLRLRASVRVEAAAAVVVVALAAVLAAYPLPPRRLAEATEGQVRPAGRSGLPEATDLTLGGDAGEVLVGLTLRPAEPGENEVLVYILPLEGEEAARGLPVRVTAGTATRVTERCGITCRRTTLRLRGGERLRVEVGGEAGGAETFEVPPLPSEPARRLFEAAQQRMQRLRTYRIEERLASGRRTIHAEYAFQAPDGMRMSLSTGSERIVLADRAWSRDAPDEPWVASTSVPLEVPRFIWERQELSVPFLLGTETVNGHRTSVVSLFSGGGTPIWFRLWVDPEGLVHRAEMRAQGHFMDHRYVGFDAPVEISPPEPVAAQGG